VWGIEGELMARVTVSFATTMIFYVLSFSGSLAFGQSQETTSHHHAEAQDPKPEAKPSELSGQQDKQGSKKRPPDQQMPEMEQEMPGTQDQMQGMKHGGMSMGAQSFIEEIILHGTSGTSAEPNSTPMPMLMAMKGNWMLMFHGVAFLNSIQQSGPRGFDKIFATNWLMPMAQKELGPGTLTLRGMFSFEPATVSKRRYPEIFQLGEAAFGKPIVDGQHPHDFFMELAVLYDLKLGKNALLSFYAAPVGDPAMGPTAFPHRISASENPLATLGHHLQDSTHIADDVLTVGLTYRWMRLEGSGFHGREPDDHRWNIDSGKIDSWSTRLTINPAQNWSGQYSVARLKSPEELNPREDTLRMTASIVYNRPLTNGNWATTLVWGRNRTLPEGEVFNSYLGESTVRHLASNYVWGRVENVDRTNQLVLGEKPSPPGFQEHFLARVQAYSLGYDHEFDLIPHLGIALGAQVTFYGAPATLHSTYGSHPRGVVLFLRVRPFRDSR
jgi:hypothetical protein